MQAEEAKASEKARVAHAMASDAQKDLDEALPALDAALASLQSLKKNDVVEVPHNLPVNTLCLYAYRLFKHCTHVAYSFAVCR